MLIDKGVKPGKVVFIIDDGRARVLVGSEINEIFSFLLIELNARSFQMSLHFLHFNVAFSFRVEKSECSEHGLGLIRFEFLVFQN